MSNSNNQADAKHNLIRALTASEMELIAGGVLPRTYQVGTKIITIGCTDPVPKGGVLIDPRHPSATA